MDFIKSYADKTKKIIIGDFRGAESQLNLIKRNLSVIENPSDKVYIITQVLEYAFKTIEKIKSNATGWSDTNNSQLNGYLQIKYFLEAEMEKTGASPSRSFTIDEKKSAEDLLEQIREKLSSMETMNSIILDELEEMKTLFFLNKKSWKQLLTGKVVDWIVGGVISKEIGDPLLDQIQKQAPQFLGY